MCVRHLGYCFQVNYVASRVAEGLEVDRFGSIVDQRRHPIDVVRGRETRVDADLRKRVSKQVVGTTVQRRRRDKIVTGLSDRKQRIRCCRLTGRQAQPGEAALHRRNALLQHCSCGVHDARINISLDLEIKQVRAMLRIVERICSRLVDRNGDGFGRRVGFVTGVYCERFNFHFSIFPW